LRREHVYRAVAYQQPFLLAPLFWILCVKGGTDTQTAMTLLIYQYEKKQAKNKWRLMRSPCCLCFTLVNTSNLIRFAFYHYKDGVVLIELMRLWIGTKDELL
jgi:hypothetical protein